MAQPQLIGRALGPYHLIERVGPDAPFTTYRAIDTRLFNQPVALTVFAPPVGEDGFLHRFERAAEALTGLRHPNILPVQDFGEVAGLAYVSTPFLEAPALATLLGRPYRLEEALRLVATLGDALDFAHRLGLAHGGIAPATIRLAGLPPGERALHGAWPLLGDFGFAALAGAGAVEHPALAPYQPPERGDGRRGDLYALAATLVTMVAGTPPRPGTGR